MKPINIFILTRINNSGVLDRAERQMSKRQFFLKIKSWEVECVKKLAEHLYEELGSISFMNFYYSFQIPKLGKEFDLLCVDENQVINVELKSGDVTDEKIKKQLAQNRQYLGLLGLNIRSYTYISSQDRLVRLTNSGRLVESTFLDLARDLKKQEKPYEDDLEKLFIEEKFLISPLTDPDKFLRREYFLTSQQKDIKNKILRYMSENRQSIQGFTGLPGTGKTLLLYDIAMELTAKDKVCILHFGSYPEEMKTLNERLKRVDFYDGKSREDIECLIDYRAVLVDEGHRVSRERLEKLVDFSREYSIPMVVSYDSEDSIDPMERRFSKVEVLEKISGFIRYKLTNRIRMNGELSSFINCIMKSDIRHRRKEYPSVSIAYADNKQEAALILMDYKNRGYIYIREEQDDLDLQNREDEIDAAFATCREFDQVVMVVDEHFFYDEAGNLKTVYPKIGEADIECMKYHEKAEIEIQGAGEDLQESRVRMLFHGLSRAKSCIALVVLNNEKVFEKLMLCLQGSGREKDSKKSFSKNIKM